jgi:DNA polymerase (family 10)
MRKEGKDVIKLAEEIKKKLNPLCKKIEIVGSIRRKEKNPEDIDIVLIPKDKNQLEEFMKNKLKGKFMQGGEYESTWEIKKIQVELYYADEKEWGAELLAYSSKKGAGIGLRVIAKKKGFKLTQHGLFNRKTKKRIAGKTEKEIYSALRRPYKKPENR